MTHSTAPDFKPGYGGRTIRLHQCHKGAATLWTCRNILFSCNKGEERATRVGKDQLRPLCPPADSCVDLLLRSVNGVLEALIEFCCSDFSSVCITGEQLTGTGQR